MVLPLLVAVLLTIFCAQTHAADDVALQQALERAGANRGQLEQALSGVPDDERAGMRFLIENMPDRDLTTLTAEFLIENSRLTWTALRKSAWAATLPEEIVFDSLLPYASVNERRDRWRAEFLEKFAPLMKDAKTPSEAAAMLNNQVFPIVNVRYSTGRKKADQSPLESMESGLASCTGLSILLVDACRAVGVPARLVGTPLWSDRSGNHTWVEIWDQGWHFTGACEPTGNVLDQGWFIDRASLAQRDERLHAIYAVTFRRNGQSFPMVWAREVQDVFAVNVTDRYTGLKATFPEGHVAVRVRVRDGRGQRTVADVRVVDETGRELAAGKTRDDRFDSNDHLTIPIPEGATVTVQLSGGNVSETVRATGREMLVDLKLP